MAINIKKFIEEYLKIKTKTGQLVNFKLNQPQLKLYEAIKKQAENNQPIRLIILKARQMGFSTLTEAIGFTNAVTNPNYRFNIIAHKDESTNNLYEMSKTFYNNLPEPLKPTERKNNAKQLIFDTKDGQGLGSTISCMTAGGKGVGRSSTIHFLHASEYAFWEGNAEDTYTSLMQAVPNTPDSMVIIESTANGYNHFKDMWDRVNAELDNEEDVSGFIPIFFAWFELDEYRMKYNGFRLNKKERELKEKYNLDNEQIAWRRWAIKNNCNGSEDIFRQEYPSNPHEAFLSTGQPVFDKEKVTNRLEQIGLKEPLKRGYFTYDKTAIYEISNIKWQDDDKGFIKIYIDRQPRHPYVLAGDTAGEGSDWFAGQVIDNYTSEQVATLRTQIDEDLYAEQMYCLGRYYHWALIGIEANYSRYPTKVLDFMNYPKLYIREREDTFTGGINKAYGFLTTSKTRPIILSELKKLVREEVELLNDRTTLEEMLTFVKNDAGKEVALPTKHDDMVMCIAIAYYIRTQQRFLLFDEDFVEEEQSPIDKFISGFSKKNSGRKYVEWD